MPITFEVRNDTTIYLSLVLGHDNLPVPSPMSLVLEIAREGQFGHRPALPRHYKHLCTSGFVQTDSGNGKRIFRCQVDKKFGAGQAQDAIAKEAVLAPVKQNSPA